MSSWHVAMLVGSEVMRTMMQMGSGAEDARKVANGKKEVAQVELLIRSSIHPHPQFLSFQF